MENLVGEEVKAKGVCLMQGKNELIPVLRGILRQVDYNPLTMELRAVIIKSDSGMERFDFTTKPGYTIRDIYKELYHNGQLVVRALPDEGNL
ncbi:hypothetical protein KY339_02220 [Candidatus Woesearchaeota archaeon]|nr:hypothetical protein [Candidatus Woesearchaeota archaeon]